MLCFKGYNKFDLKVSWYKGQKISKAHYLALISSKKMSFLDSALKVSKFRKQIELFSFEPKTERNISALRIDP
jgi:hypothetical protein